MVRAHQVQVGMRMIFSAAIVALNRILLGETHRHANAGYKLIAAVRMEEG
jgi:hypothetical protein